MIMKLAELDRLEDELVEDYKNKVGKIVNGMSGKEFKGMLLQRK